MGSNIKHEPSKWREVEKLLDKRTSRMSISRISKKFTRLTEDKDSKDEYESLLSLDVRSNLLLRALRVRIDCRELLDQIKYNSNSWLLLPPNIILAELEINENLVASHLIKFNNSSSNSNISRHKNKKKEFTTATGKNGTVDFEHK